MEQILRKDLDHYAQQELFWIAGRIPDLAKVLLLEKGLDSSTLDEAIKDFYAFSDSFIEKYFKEKGEQDDEDKR